MMMLAGLAGSVDAASLPPLQVQARTQNFVYYSRAGQDVDVKRSERFVELIQGTLRVKSSKPTDYYRVDHAAVVEARTGLYAVAATDLSSGTIVSTRAYDPHEIVHRIAAEIGNPGLFFHEGLAVALADKGRVGGEKAGRLARSGLERRSFAYFVQHFDRTPEAYGVAGSFVTFLVDEFGAGRLREYFESCGSSGRPSAEAFQRVFGVTLDEMASRWQRSL